MLRKNIINILFTSILHIICLILLVILTIASIICIILYIKTYIYTKQYDLFLDFGNIYTCRCPSIDKTSSTNIPNVSYPNLFPVTPLDIPKTPDVPKPPKTPDVPELPKARISPKVECNL